MTIYKLKPAFQNLLRPLCRSLAAIGVTANQVTLAAMALSIAVGALVALYPDRPRLLLLVPLTLFLRMALNAIDGMLAREHGMESPLGAMLNELGDVISDAALYLPLALHPGVYGPLVILIVVGAGLTELAGVVATQIGAGRRYDGPMGKSDRAFVMGATALALGVGEPGGRWVTIWLGGILLLTALTVRNRVRAALAERAESS
ncbi:hypothetical protein ABI59_20165 [Acidobacteria bacterium Mor1]|nr:hypothetical protein ABI59_20165 [Acidobacteria bacterium Mor1]